MKKSILMWRVGFATRTRAYGFGVRRVTVIAPNLFKAVALAEKEMSKDTLSMMDKYTFVVSVELVGEAAP